MGTDCAPVVALFAYECEFMKGLLKDNITLAIKFSNTYRYIDDLLCINNKDFELSISDKPKVASTSKEMLLRIL